MSFEAGKESETNAELHPPSASPRSRLVSVDALRGLAVLLMVQQHLGIWLLDVPHNLRAVRSGFGALNATGGAAAPLFILLAGVGIALADPKRLPSRALVFRGFGLLGLGLLLNLLTPSWFSPASWYVLHLLGTWWVFAPAARRLPDAWLLMLAAALLAFSVFGRAWLETPLHLRNTMMRDGRGFLGPLRLALVEGQFPILPWISFSLLGLWAGRRLEKPGLLWTTAVLFGALALLLRAPALVDENHLREGLLKWVCRFSFYPATPVFAIALLAIGLALLAIFVALEKQFEGRGLRWLVPLGRTSLTLLMLHVVVFREGAHRLGLAREQGVSLTLTAIIAVLVGWTLVAHVWKKFNYRFSLEWWLRRVN